MNTTLESILIMGRTQIADEMEAIANRNECEALKREGLERQYFAMLNALLQSALPEALWDYIDTSDIKMSDAGYMDSHPWSVFLRVPGCAPVRISTCVIMTRRDGGWDKAVLMDCNQLSLPSVRRDGFNTVFNHQYPENYQIDQLPYVLARAEVIQKEFDDLNAQVEKDRAEYEANEAAEHAAYLARKAALAAQVIEEAEPTEEERLVESLSDLIGKIVDAAFSARGL